jgi:hypothetical protein
MTVPSGDGAGWRGITGSMDRPIPASSSMITIPAV